MTSATSTMWRSPGKLAAVTAVLVVLVWLVPWPLAQQITGASWPDPHALAQTVAGGFVTDQAQHTATPGEPGSGLHAATGFWRWFHLAKAVLTVPLVLAAGLLTLPLWPTPGSTPGPGEGRLRRLTGSAAGIAIAVATLTAVVVLVANIQGAAAPLASVLSFLPEASGPGAAGAAAAVRQQAISGSPDRTTAVMLDSFAAYHAVLAALAVIVAVAGLTLAAVLWRHRHRLAGLAVLVTGLGFGLIAAANVNTASHPAPAFAAFLEGVVR